MKANTGQALLAACVVAGLACRTPQAILPPRQVPPGTILIQFTKKVAGPVELTVDGTRIPVDKVAKKKGLRLEISGLSEGRHHLFLMSPLEAFGPDQLEVDLGPAAGAFQVVFAQQFQSVLYGSPEPAPAAAGLPGVKARLQP